MTPCEYFLKWIVKPQKLALITFLFLEYLYMLSYHPSNLTLFEISEIPGETQLKGNLLNIEDKITRYKHHNELLRSANLRKA